MSQELINSTKVSGSTISRLIIPITYILLVIHFILNFLISPLLIPFYAVELAFIILVVLSTDFNKSIIPIISLFFIEGQGRILMSYHPVMRNIFDIVIGLAILKSISQKRSIMPMHALPHGLIFVIGLHFIWYSLQIFNVNSIGILGVVAASKIYIFPFFMFFLFLNNPLTKNNLLQLQNLIIFIVAGECALSIYQMNLQESSVLPITGYYMKSLRQGIFTGLNFRPYGTGFAPGSFSVYFFLTVGFFFFKAKNSVLKNALILILQILTWFCLFIMQVRSALLKHIIILVCINIGFFLISELKVKAIVKFAIMISIFIFGLSFLPNMETLFPDIDFKKSTERIAVLSDIEQAGAQRAGASTIIELAIKKLGDNPLGLAPGRTGAASTLGASFIASDPLYDRFSSWTHDNLIISLIIDLGVGCIFYISFIGILLIKLIFNTFLHYYNRRIHAYRVSLIASVSCSLIIAGNWGAVGLPYNPESFIFWFFLAVGLNANYIEEEEMQSPNNMEDSKEGSSPPPSN